MFGGTDKKLAARPSPPLEWVVLNTARNYQCLPHEAWHAMGYGRLGPLARRRLTMACSGLWGLANAYEEVGRKRGKDAPPVPIDSVLTFREADSLYNCRAFGRDSVLDDLIVYEYQGKPPPTLYDIVTAWTKATNIDAGIATREVWTHLVAMRDDGLITWNPGKPARLTDAGRPVAESVRITAVDGYPPPPGAPPMDDELAAMLAEEIGAPDVAAF